MTDPIREPGEVCRELGDWSALEFLTGIALFLIGLSAAILLTLGSIHLAYTFLTGKFRPRDPSLEARLKEVSPVITKQTTMWKAWVGFNASHSLGAMLFGAIYLYLVSAQGQLLLGSFFLCGLGLAFLRAYLALAKLYWFNVPLAGVSLAALSYVIGLSLGWGG